MNPLLLLLLLLLLPLLLLLLRLRLRLLLLRLRLLPRELRRRLLLPSCRAVTAAAVGELRSRLELSHGCCCCCW